MKDGLRFVDSDMHIMEPPDLFDRYLDPKFKDRVSGPIGADGRPKRGAAGLTIIDGLTTFVSNLTDRLATATKQLADVANAGGDVEAEASRIQHILDTAKANDARIATLIAANTPHEDPEAVLPAPLVVELAQGSGVAFHDAPRFNSTSWHRFAIRAGIETAEVVLAALPTAGGAATCASRVAASWPRLAAELGRRHNRLPKIDEHALAAALDGEVVSLVSGRLAAHQGLAVSNGAWRL